MSSIPKYFYRLFESVQTIEEHLGIKFEELSITAAEKKLLEGLSSNILVVKQNQKEEFYSRWDQYNKTTGPNDAEASIQNKLFATEFTLNGTLL